MSQSGWKAAIALTLLLLVPLTSWAEDLFTLSLRVSPEQMKAGEDALLAKALRIEVVRLTGEPDATRKMGPERLRNPRRWVVRYTFLPRKVEGVTVGQVLQVTFDKRRLLDAFDQVGLRFWPPSVRPALLVIGWWNAYGTEKMVTPTLAQRPDLDLGYAAYLLGLQARLPDKDQPALRRPVINGETVEALRRRYGIDGVVRAYFEERFEQGRRQVRAAAEAMLPEWGGTQRGQTEAATPADAFRALLGRFLPRWRARYGSAAGTESIVRLVLRRPTPQTLFRLEKLLNAAAPIVRQATLVELDRKAARFEVIYQGPWSTLAQRLNRLPGFQIFSANVPRQRIELVHE